MSRKSCYEVHPVTFVAGGAKLIGRVILEEGASWLWEACLRDGIVRFPK
ncbi:MAG: hypothetical protein MUP28_08585 [Candidatus Aminicenantes bacterium]|nr:hypothetical protein [Candidatus Aminicenantes bacterium]